LSGGCWSSLGALEKTLKEVLLITLVLELTPLETYGDHWRRVWEGFQRRNREETTLERLWRRFSLQLQLWSQHYWRPLEIIGEGLEMTLSLYHK